MDSYLFKKVIKEKKKKERKSGEMERIKKKLGVRNCNHNRM